MGRKDYIADIRQEIQEIRDKHSDLNFAKAFTFWYIRGFLWPTSFEGIYDEVKIKSCIYCQPKELKIDGIYEDHDLKIIFLVQTKFRTGEKPESKAGLKAFKEVADFVKDPDEKRFNEFVNEGAADTKSKLREVRKLVNERGYRLDLHFVTTGRVNKEYLGKLRKSLPEEVYLEVVDRGELNRLYEDYIEVGQPPLPLLELPVAKDEPISWKGKTIGVESWLFAMNVKDLANIYERTGRRIFARNIRAYLGEGKAVNKGIKRTIENEPGRFWFYNNGVTIICSEASYGGTAGEMAVLIKNAQVINGQQTIRVLAETLKLNEILEEALILVKVFVVKPATDDFAIRSSREFVDRIVEGTNTQNQVDIPSLKSNDYQQIRLQREFMKLRYYYVRKKGLRETKIPGHKIYKEKLAITTATMKLDPSIAAKGRSVIFEDYYEVVFNEEYDIWFYLCAHYLYKFVEDVSKKDIRKGSKERVLAKYILSRLLWDKVNVKFRARKWELGKKFVNSYHKKGINNKSLRKLRNLSKSLFHRAREFYIETTKNEPVEPSGFYRRPNKYDDFKRFLKNKTKADTTWGEFIDMSLSNFIKVLSRIETV